MQVYFQLFANDIKQHYVWLKRQEGSPSLHVERRQWGDTTAAAPAAVAAAAPAAVAAAAPTAIAAAAARAVVATAARVAVAAAARTAITAAAHAAIGRGRGRLRPRSVVGRHWSLLVDVAVGGPGR